MEMIKKKVHPFHLAQLPISSHKGGPRGIQKTRLTVNLVISISFFDSIGINISMCVSISITFCIILTMINDICTSAFSPNIIISMLAIFSIEFKIGSIGTKLIWSTSAPPQARPSS